MHAISTNRAHRRAEDRARRLRQRRPSARKRQRGQTLVIFALSVTVLLGLASLAIDAMRAYDLYAREERAAEAGALAGVLYMPCSYDSNGANPPVASATPCASTTSPDGLTARQRALQEVQKNGFGTSLTVGGMPDGCLGGVTTAEVTACGVSGRVNALQVTISEPITTFFLFTSIGGNGNQSFMVTATAGADYLSSAVLGDSPSDANSNVWGDGDSNNPKYWVPAINGPAEFKENGDPYVYCEEGPSSGPLNSALYPTSNGGADENLWQGGTQTFGNTSPGPAPLYDLGNTNQPAGAGTGGSGLQGDSGQLTNHPQWPTGPACGVPGSAQAINGGNPDQQPSGFAGEATKNTVHPGAYTFVINVPRGSPGVDIWIYNPVFDPTTPQPSCLGNQPQDRFPLDIGCNNYYTDYGVTNSTTPTCSTPPCPMIQLNSTAYASANVDDPRLYFDMTYSIYAMSSNGLPGTTLATPAQTFHPYDTTDSDLARHGCATAGSGGAYDLSDYSAYTPGIVTAGKGCSVHPLGVYQWVPVDANSIGGIPVGLMTPGNYRLAIEASTFAPSGNPNPACNNNIGLCGWGHHIYSILVCQHGGGTPTGGTCPTGSGGGKIAAWNNMDLYLNFPSARGPDQEDSTPLANISADFAGHTIEIGLFDAGDSHSDGGSNWFMIIPPDCSINPKNGTPLPYGNGDGAGHSQPAWARTAQYPISNPNHAPQCQQDHTSMWTSAPNPGTNPSDGIYNGLWIWTRITLPNNYGAKCGTSCEWYMNETSGNGKDFDQYTIAFRLDDPSPVHLIF